MPRKADVLEQAHQWFRYAEADLAYARLPLPVGGLYEQACFHAQQTAEKAMKAVLIAWERPFPYTHNLQRLLELVPEEQRFPELIDATQLTDYAVIARYPTSDDPATESDQLQAIRWAETVLQWAAEQLRANEET
jgi:HEPN domain-containing protein